MLDKQTNRNEIKYMRRLEEKTKEVRIVEEIEKRNLRWHGHLVRMNQRKAKQICDNLKLNLRREKYWEA